MNDPAVRVRMLAEQIDELAVGFSVAEYSWEWALMLWPCQNDLLGNETLWDETSYPYAFA